MAKPRIPSAVAKYVDKVTMTPTPEPPDASLFEADPVKYIRQCETWRQSMAATTAEQKAEPLTDEERQVQRLRNIVLDSKMENVRDVEIRVDYLKSAIETIDTLQASVAAVEGERDTALREKAEVEAERDNALNNKGLSDDICEAWKERAIKAEAERDAARADAAHWKGLALDGIYKQGALKGSTVEKIVYCRFCGEWNDRPEHVKHLPSCITNSTTAGADLLKEVEALREFKADFLRARIVSGDGTCYAGWTISGTDSINSLAKKMDPNHPVGIAPRSSEAKEGV